MLPISDAGGGGGGVASGENADLVSFEIFFDFFRCCSSSPQAIDLNLERHCFDQAMTDVNAF